MTDAINPCAVRVFCEKSRRFQNPELAEKLKAGEQRKVRGIEVFGALFGQKRDFQAEFSDWIKNPRRSPCAVRPPKPLQTFDPPTRAPINWESGATNRAGG
jgi:hypothetical protein